MAEKHSNDQLAIIRIEGMHCHQCEQMVQKTLSAKPGVHEVEVDFNSQQASVLFDPKQVKIAQLMAAVDEAGYHAASFTRIAAQRKA